MNTPMLPKISPEDPPPITHAPVIIPKDPPTPIQSGKYLRARPITKYLGRDAYGKNIPHERSKEVADYVSMCIAGGAHINDIAVALNIRPGTLRVHYGKELRSSSFKENMKVVSAALAMAQSGEDPDMTKFWLKARMGWTDKEKSDTGDEGLLNIHIYT